MMELRILGPDPQSVEYKLDNAFYKGGDGDVEVEETPADRAAAEVALKRYTRYAEVYRPFEEASFKEMTDPVGAARFKNKVKGQMSANQAQMMDTMISKGADPSSGAHFGALTGRKTSQDFANTMSRAEGLDRDQRIAGLQAAVNVGTGQANDVQITSDRLASAALDESIGRARTNYMEESDRLNALATGAGMLTRGGIYAYDQMKTPSGGQDINTWDGTKADPWSVDM